MRDYGERLRRGLEGYENILWEKALALPKHQPQLARWVKEFLLFAREHGGYTFEQTLDLFLAGLGGAPRFSRDLSGSGALKGRFIPAQGSALGSEE